jgi:hypothetical protein
MTVYVWFEHTGCKNNWRTVKPTCLFTWRSCVLWIQQQFEQRLKKSFKWMVNGWSIILRSSGRCVGSVLFSASIVLLGGIKGASRRQSAADNQLQTSGFTRQRDIYFGKCCVRMVSVFMVWYSRGLEVGARGSNGILVERRIGGAVGLTGKDALKWCIQTYLLKSWISELQNCKLFRSMEILNMLKGLKNKE